MHAYPIYWGKKGMEKGIKMKTVLTCGLLNYKKFKYLPYTFLKEPLYLTPKFDIFSM